MADDITELVRLLREKPDITSHCAASCIEGFQRKAAKVSPDPVVVRLEREVNELTGKTGELARERDSYRDALYTARRERDAVRSESQGRLDALVKLVKEMEQMQEDNATLRGLLREAVEAWNSPAYRFAFRNWRGNPEWYDKAQAALEGKP